ALLSGCGRLPATSAALPALTRSVLMATAAGSIAKPSARPLKILWTCVAVVAVFLAILLYVARDSSATVAGFSIDQLIVIEAILFLSGLMSGLSGFGFSAVGAATLLLMKPILEAPLLQTLSTGNQLLSVEQLRADMPRSWSAFWKGPGFCIL